MKSFIYIFTMLMVFAIVGPTLSRAENTEPDYRRFTDIIYEWTYKGEIIQIGDFTISNIKSVWIDQGQRDAFGKPILVHGSRYDIEVGQLATPLMLDEKDSQGFWTAEKLILYSGKGLEEALKRMPANIRDSYLSKTR